MNVQLKDAPGNEEKALWSLMSINHFAIVVLDETIEHVQMGSTNYEKPS